MENKIKIGDTLICKKSHEKDITKEKEYTVIDVKDDTVYITDDEEWRHGFSDPTFSEYFEIKQMKKTIELTLEQAKEIYKTADDSMKALLEDNFEELKPVEIGWYLAINEVYSIKTKKDKLSKSIFKTEKQALSALAYAQLTQEMHEIGDGFAGVGKFYIVVSSINQKVISVKTNTTNDYSLLSFNDKDKCHDFAVLNQGLIKQFYQID